MNIHKQKNFTLGMVLAWAFVFGMGDYFIGEESASYRMYNIVVNIVSVIFLMRWFVLDAREHSFRFSPPMFLMMVAALVLVAPFYFVRTRGKRAWRPILGGLLFFVLASCAFLLGSQAAYRIRLATYEPSTGLQKPLPPF